MRAVAFFNTVGLTGNDLSNATHRAEGEREIVYSIMKILKEPCTSFEIYQYWVNNNLTERISPTLLQNIRRALSVLEFEDRVINTCQRRMAGYGVPNTIWRVI